MMSSGISRVLVAVLPVVASLGCGQGGGDSSANSISSPLTFWGDIASILNRKCVTCHQPGSIGPFPLDDYQNAKLRAPLIASVTQQGIMPPYLATHDGSCGNLEDDETLTADEIARIFQWATGGSKEGQPVTLPKVNLPGLPDGRDFKTPEIVPVVGGGLLAKNDEYRCFPFDSGLDRDGFITGYDVKAGNPAIVHHVVLFVVDPDQKNGDMTNGDLIKSLDADDPDRPGWPCFGLSSGLWPDSVPVVWSPGQGAVSYPDTMGVRLRKTDKIVVQVHYNLSDPSLRGQADSTNVRLRVADAVDRQIVFRIHDAMLDSLLTTPVALPPGMPSVKFTWSKTATQMTLDGFPWVDLVGVSPHMHARGRHKEMRIMQPDGSDSCAVKVNRWDTHWQKFYMYKGTVPRFTPDTKIQLTCDYDTTAEKAPVYPGFGSGNEMCSAVLMFALPPGAVPSGTPGGTGNIGG
jgi:hypothetical protein